MARLTPITLIVLLLAMPGCCGSPCCPRHCYHPYYHRCRSQPLYSRSVSGSAEYSTSSAPIDLPVADADCACRPVYEMTWDAQRGWTPTVKMVPETGITVTTPSEPPNRRALANGSIDARSVKIGRVYAVEPELLMLAVRHALPKLGYSMEQGHHQDGTVVITTTEKQEGQWYTRHKITATFEKHSDLVGFEIETRGSKQVQGGRLPSEFRNNQAADSFLKQLRDTLTEESRS